MASRFVFAALLLSGSCLIQPTTAELPTCTVDAMPNTITCDGFGKTWPLQHENPMRIPVTTVHLRLHNMNLPADDTTIQQLPANLTALTRLDVLNVPSSGEGKTFPLGFITAPLTPAAKSQLATVHLAKVTLPKLSTDVLSGFGLTGLTEISIRESGLAELDANTFTTVPRLQRLLILAEPKLAKFQWAVLTPVASVFQTLWLEELSALTEVVAPSATIALPMLKGIAVMKTGLTAVPATLAASLPTAASGQTKVDVVFTDNANPCSDCKPLEPLINWAKAPATFAGSELSVSCKATNGATQTVSATAAVWKADKPACIPDVISTGASLSSVSFVSLLVCLFAAFKKF